MEKDLEFAAESFHQDLADAWAKTFRTLTAIEEMETSKKEDLRPAGALTELPVWVTQGKRSLEPRELSLEELRAITEGLAGIQDLAEKFPTRSISLQIFDDRMKTLIGRVGEMDEDSVKLLYEARRLLNGIRWDMWHALDKDDLIKRAFDSEVEAVDEALGRLSDYLDPPADPEKGNLRVPDPHDELVGILLGQKASPVLPNMDLLTDPAVPTESYPVPSRLSAVAQRASGPILSRFVVGLSLAAILWSGLQILYFDKAWGTPIDIITAFVWGLSGKALLDVVGNIIQKLRAPQLPTPAESIFTSPAT